MYFDGSLMKEGAGGAVIFVSPLGEQLWYTIRLHFPTSNNMEKYEILVNGLRIAVELGIQCLDVLGDSQLVVGQVMKDLECHNPKMVTYCKDVHRLEEKFNCL